MVVPLQVMPDRPHLLKGAEAGEAAILQQPLPLPDGTAHILRAVAEGKCDKGIVICTTGIGISIAANKVKGIRCAHCADCLQAEMTRKHNDANMMAIGAGFTGKNMAERMVEVFLSTEFEGGRHERRVNKMMALEG